MRLLQGHFAIQVGLNSVGDGIGEIGLKNLSLFTLETLGPIDRANETFQ